MKNPCEICLVRACCKIPTRIVYFNCGCDDYEIYRTFKSYYNYSSHNKRLTQLMMDNDTRMKQINFKNKHL